MKEAGIAELEPAVLLREASYANQWLTQVESVPVELTHITDSAICVFAPNVVTTPHDTSLRYLGPFSYNP
jgi:hypothetical protein